MLISVYPKQEKTILTAKIIVRLLYWSLYYFILM